MDKIVFINANINLFYLFLRNRIQHGPVKKYLCSILLFINCCFSGSGEGLVRGITLLSDDTEKAMLAIEAGAANGVNHLQLSHRIIHSLCEIRDPGKQRAVAELCSFAHEKGIEEVCLWDHCLYDTDYYPAGFKYPGTGLLDLDNEGLWDWIKEDYRQMMRLCPEADGIVLTFIESGARVEWQRSAMSTPQRLAKIISSVSSVICGELGKKLWLRTFAYTAEEYADISESLDSVEWLPGMGIMVKETPHDFFAFHPDNPYVGLLKHPTLVEFDACGEYNGQGVILSTRPGALIQRWGRYSQQPNVVGFTARTDRMGRSQIFCTPGELNIYALLRAGDTPGITTEKVCRDFVSERYGPKAVRHLVPALLAGGSVIDGTMYIMGLSTTHHSKLDFEDQSTYARHVPARWTQGKTVRLGHGVNKRFHWWKDLVNILAPPALKSPDGRQAHEIDEAFSKGWLDQDENITPKYVRYIDRWTERCIKDARKGQRHLRKARRALDKSEYRELSDLYERSLMCLRLRRSAAICYWGGRAWQRDGGRYRSRGLRRRINRACNQLDKSLEAYRRYDKPYPSAAWDWKSDAEAAAHYRFHADD